jgi:hypothetical protein
MTKHTDHRAFARALKDRAATAPGLSPQQLRQEALLRAAGGATLEAPYDALVSHVADASYRVTDAEVAAVRQALGSEKATFEIIMSAAIGAAMLRFDRAMDVLKDGSDAAR